MERERRRTMFEQVPELYDRARPTYPEGLFDELADLRLARRQIGHCHGDAGLGKAERHGASQAARASGHDHGGLGWSNTGQLHVPLARFPGHARLVLAASSLGPTGNEALPAFASKRSRELPCRPGLDAVPGRC